MNKLLLFKRLILISLIFVFQFGLSTAQTPSLNDLLAIPYVGKVVGASKADKIAFSVNEKGWRNVFYAEGPLYKSVKATQFDKDDGQEISSLTISEDGKWIIFVRGGDHGANSAPVPTNSASLVKNTSIEIFSYSVEEDKLFEIGVGNNPQINPDNASISYIKSGQVWHSPLNQSNSGKQLFNVRGSVASFKWSPDGTQLSFVSRRTTHSFIGVFSKYSDRINWISPSFYMDSNPQWSPDGKQIAFIRMNAVGGGIDSITSFDYQPWSIEIADLNTGQLRQVYKSIAKREGTYPRIAGQANLSWSHPDYITFMSYNDGWPHLYRIDKRTSEIIQLTKGEYTIDQISTNLKGTEISFSANYGSDRYDFDRSHIGTVDIASGKMKMITDGIGLEMFPFFFNNDQLLGFKSSTYNSPAKPTIYSVKSKNQKVIAGDIFKEIAVNFTIPEQVFIQAEDGVKSSAQLFKPKKGKENGAALVYIHGGPRRQMYLGWHQSDYYSNDYIVNQYLAQQGFTVLAINYRLGTGYGFEFQHPENAGSLGASEYLDIIAAGRWLQSRSGVDPKRVGVFGGSYGGYLAAMGLAKNSDVFSAGVDIHGVHNRQRKQNPDYYAPDFELASKLNWESSPSKWVEGWKSPVLIIHGDDDQNVAFSQSIDLYKRLKNNGIEMEVLVLPDENHHWLLHENLLKVKEATVDFLKRKLIK